MDEDLLSPGSPSLLPVGTPSTSPRTPPTWRENPDSETYTLPDDPGGGNTLFSVNQNFSNDVLVHVDSNNDNATWHPINDAHNDQINAIQPNEDSNQSVSATLENRITLPTEAWTPVLGLFDDNSNSVQTQSSAMSEDIAAITPMNEESDNSTAVSDSRHTKDESDEPPAKLRKLNCPQQIEDVDGETCPICLDLWGNSGKHRLVSLKCGHLFGMECVERWLKAQNVKNRTCPTCKGKAALKDIRFIYARKLVAADTVQVTALQEQLEQLQSKKNKSELELEKTKIAYHSCAIQLEVLRTSLLNNKVPKEQLPRKSWRFALEKNLEICKDGGCRVLTYNFRTYEFYVSQKSTNNLFPGFGIRKVSCVDYKLGQFVHLHPKPIRDITYSQPRDLLLSVALDNTARIVERGIPSSTIQCGVPLWSCSWDYLRSNEFYVGGVGGVIQQYDVRNPGSYIQRLTAPGDMSPVVSLCSTEYGLLSCQLNSCRLWTSKSRQWEPKALPVDGPFMSLCYDNDSRRALVSVRASGNDRSRLTLCKLHLKIPSGEVGFDARETFAGSVRSTLMSRSAWVKAPGATWVAAHSESDSSLHLHGLDGARTMCLPAAEPALDVCAAQLNGDTVLAALSDTRLRLYKAVSTNF